MINKEYCREYCKKHFIEFDTGNEYCRNHHNLVPLACMGFCIHNSPEDWETTEIVCPHCGEQID